MQVLQRRYMIATLWHVLCCTTLKETTKCMACGHRKSCTAIPTCTSKVMCCQPQPCESTNIERKLFQLHLMQWDVFVPYEKHMIKQLKSIVMLQHRDKKFSIEDLPWKSWADGWWQCGSLHQHAYQNSDAICQNSNWSYREDKHKRSNKDKNSYSNYFHICINTDAYCVYTTKPVVSLEKDYKILWYPSKIVWLFGFHIYTTEKHM